MKSEIILIKPIKTETTPLDIDECADTYTCGLIGECHNTPGSFECHCPENYSLLNNKCVG